MDLERLARETGVTDTGLGAWMTDYGDCEDAIRAFAAAVRREALEEAAKVCDSIAEYMTHPGKEDEREGALQCAYEIRSLIEPSSPPER